MTSLPRTGRLSILAAAMVVARRDFVAILWSRSFIFFLLGPLFPLFVGAMAGSIGAHVDQSAAAPQVGLIMAGPDIDAMLTAQAALAPRMDGAMPDLVVIKRLRPKEAANPAEALADGRLNGGNLAAVISGSAAHPVLTGTRDRIEEWRGPVELLAARATGLGPTAFPHVRLSATASSTANRAIARVRTAQAAQTLLFLLTMLLAGMVLSNLVEEKGNKIIEVLAAAIPMDAVFLGKLFAMLAVSMVGIGVWGSAVGVAQVLGGEALPQLPAPAVGWPLFVALGVAYFAMGYLLLGSVFLSVGSMASTVREVQTLSMPVTMVQLLVFFFASYAMARQGSTVEYAACIVPFSSPFAMLARAATVDAVWPHVAALGWQAAWVAVFVRTGAHVFRRRVMQSGSGSGQKAARRGLLGILRGARPQ